MSDDRSLDEFATGAAEPSAGASDDGASDDPDSTDERDGERTVEPAVSTYAWSPSGASCASCGATVERRWRDEGDLVCADCKSW